MSIYKMERKKMTIYFWILLTVAVLDQLTKALAMDLIAAANRLPVEQLAEGNTLPILEDILHFTYLENTGMSFGLLADKRWIFMLLSAVGIALLLAYLISLKGNGRLVCTALSLVIGGGVGNMFDRIFLGYVVDFIDVRCIPGWKWIFNFADSAVCVGAGLLILGILLEYKKERAK